MESIRRGQTNTVYFTLKEKGTLTTPYYLFVLTNRNTGIATSFNATDTSSYKYRYNSFEIQETSGTNDLDNGIVTLTEGDYTYKIYEQTSATNKVVASTIKLLEEGFIKVTQAQTATAKHSATKTYTVYER